MRQRLEAETPEQRDARLEHMRTLQQQRLEVETPEQRDARLEHMKTLQKQRLEVETPQEREKMCAPQIDQGYVKGKMNRFYTEMLSIESLLYHLLGKISWNKNVSQITRMSQMLS